LQYTIEARQLTGDQSDRLSLPSEMHQLIVEAGDAGEAISNFVARSEADLVEFHRVHGRETIATVKKADSLFLLRVYPI
jgi:hypothetical protein